MKGRDIKPLIEEVRKTSDKHISKLTELYLEGVGILKESIDNFSSKSSKLAWLMILIAVLQVIIMTTSNWGVIKVFFAKSLSKTTFLTTY